MAVATRAPPSIYAEAALSNARLRMQSKESTLASTSTKADLVSMIAQEVVSGIDEAVGYWFNRIEQELVGGGLSAEQQLRGVELVIREYKEATGKLPFRCAEA
jgi:hypothetical protein